MSRPPKQFLNLTQAPKLAPFSPKKPETTPKLDQHLRVKIEGNIENRNCYTSGVMKKLATKKMHMSGANC